jgi:hypothetical protein
MGSRQQHGIDGRRILDPDDRELADLLIQAASGNDVEADVVRFFVDQADALDYPK